MNKYEVKAVNLLIFAGQSNMQGQSECLSENACVAGAEEYKFLTNELVPLCNPIGENIKYDMTEGYAVEPDKISRWLSDHVLGAACFGNTNLVPSFCRAYIEATGDDVVAVHAAKGSTKIAEWKKGTDGHTALVKKAQAAIEKTGKANINKIYFVWLQGESDALASTSQKEYKSALINLKNDLKEELEISKFGIIKVGRFAADARDDEILEAQEQACIEDDDFVMLTRLSDEIFGNIEFMNRDWYGHFNAKGLEKIGEAAGKALGQISI